MGTTHLNNETITTFSCQGFSRSIATTSPSPSCWICWEAWERLSYEARENMNINWHVVKMNSKYYPFKSFKDAYAFALQWQGDLLTPICNP
jgi:hypothetical protein